FFKKNGLDVTLIEGKGSGNSATFVDAGQAEYSYGDLLTALQVMSKGGKNRAIGVGMTFNGGGLIFLESSGIKKAKDLEGKRFGTNPGDFAFVLLPAVAAASGFDYKKVVIKTMEPAVRTPALFEDWAWSLKNRKEAFEIFMSANPQKDRDISLAQMEAGLDDVVDPETKQQELGYMKESMMKRSVDIANKYFELSPAVDYKMTYTNQFIRKTPGM